MFLRFKMDNDEKYIPGVCNIDAGGRRKRAIFGIIVLVISIALWYYLQTLSVNLWQLFVVIPLWLGFNGIWQARFSFCVGNASRHQYEINGKIEKVTDKDQIAQDKKKAMQINIYSIVSAILLTAVLFLISNLMK